MTAVGVRSSWAVTASRWACSLIRSLRSCSCSRCLLWSRVTLANPTCCPVSS